ncbi:VOC family protein [Oerskovia turbata]|uniref:VOC family protein n=1 Tax=Oerskovia turbata TaxID=1713 RepID=A0A4Q1L1L1_9CELL|nr:VOC family protein [Oerskovia turbata]RXR26180.1 VOC family protein [Oerskovia turbata]RXR36682.1 VOC family protein [Oerskovia turbata]TGJ97372.1 VOC family protein [Actinotalea fermentans ATCC 43279 = JCM 9966 = DSM 3133]
MRPIVPSLWFNGGLEEAVAYYTSVFPDSTVGDSLRMPDGTLVTLDFTLQGQPFNLINGGPDHLFPFSEAVSFIVRCEDEAEVDHYWDALLSGGGTESRCGWLKDRYGLSWQVVPVEFEELAQSDDQEAVARMMGAMMQMIKLDMPALRAAFEGKQPADA